MRILVTTLILLATLCAAPAREPIYLPSTAFCYADGAEYESTISREAVLSIPAWNPSDPLPISFERAIEVARAELRKLVKAPDDWDCESVTLERLRGTRPERWYLVIRFGQEFRPEQINASFRPQMMQVYVDLAGRSGTILPKKKE